MVLSRRMIRQIIGIKDSPLSPERSRNTLLPAACASTRNCQVARQSRPAAESAGRPVRPICRAHPAGGSRVVKLLSRHRLRVLAAPLHFNSRSQPQEKVLYTVFHDPSLYLAVKTPRSDWSAIIQPHSFVVHECATGTKNDLNARIP